MRNDRIYDAINLYKFSPTAKGNAHIGGGAAYKQRYNKLAKDVVDKLWSLWSLDKISFAHLPNCWGASILGQSIRLSHMIEPSSNIETYKQPFEQGKLAICSCVLVHEAVHQLRSTVSIIEQEMICRTLSTIYSKDMNAGRSYHSRFANADLRAVFSPTPYYNMGSSVTDQNYIRFEYMQKQIAIHKLIDYVFWFESYRDDLGNIKTADFIVKSLHWWGGLLNRKPETRGYYLRSLAAQAIAGYALSILEILESFPPTSVWHTAKSCAGSMEKIKRALIVGSHINDIKFQHRLQQVQNTLREDFGV